MNWFIIPKYIRKDIGNAKMNFFWNENKDEDGAKVVTPTVARDKIYMPKCKGDSGIRRIEGLNGSFLTKQGSKTLTQSINICDRVMKAK